METQTSETVEVKLQRKVKQYKSAVAAQEPTLAEKRLASYQRLMDRRRAVFEITDTQHRLNILPYASDFCLVLNSMHAENRTVTRAEFVSGIESYLASGQITNPEAISEYRIYLREDRDTPYSKKPLSERVSEEKHALIKYFFPWR
jgi:hypothetical protein